jgi:hypothetical protein
MDTGHTPDDHRHTGENDIYLILNVLPADAIDNPGIKKLSGTDEEAQRERSGWFFC